MTRINQILLGLAAVQAIILAIVLLTGGSDAGSSVEARSLVSVSADRIATIRIKEENKELVLRRKGDGWVVASAGDYPADAARIEKPKPKEGETADEPPSASKSLLEKLASIEVKRPVLRKAENHATVKVADDAFDRRVVLEDADGKDLGTLYVASGSQRGVAYVRRAGEDEVYQSPDIKIWDFSTSVSSWADMKAVDLKLEDVKTFTANVTKDDKTTTLTFERREVKLDPPKKKEDEKPGEEPKEDEKPAEPETKVEWWLTAPEEAKAKTSDVEAAINKLVGLRFSDVAGKEAPGDAGFDKPQGTYELVMKDGSKHSFVIGAKAEWEFWVKYSESPYYGKAWSLDSLLELEADKVKEEQPKPEEEKKEETPEKKEEESKEEKK